MGINESKIVIFENEKGQVIKCFKTNKTIWRYKNGDEYECDIKLFDLSSDEFSNIYKSMKSEDNGYKIVEHSIIFCNCEKCIKTKFENYIPNKWLPSIRLNITKKNYITYDKDKTNYIITGFLSVYRDKINIFIRDFKKIVICFEGLTFTSYILLLSTKLE